MARLLYIFQSMPRRQHIVSHWSLQWNDTFVLSYFEPIALGYIAFGVLNLSLKRTQKYIKQFKTIASLVKLRGKRKHFSNWFSGHSNEHELKCQKLLIEYTYLYVCINGEGFSPALKFSKLIVSLKISFHSFSVILCWACRSVDNILIICATSLSNLPWLICRTDIVTVSPFVHGAPAEHLMNFRN